MQGSLIFIFCDQLSMSLSSLKQIKKDDMILMCEQISELTYIKHHPKKIAFMLSAMRHFAEELRKKNYNVRYIDIEHPDNTGSIKTEIERTLALYQPKKFIVTEPSEFRHLLMLQAIISKLNIPVEIHTDTRFLCTIQEFKNWATGKKQLRMEFFYREMRKNYGILTDTDGGPTGGAWNFDKENRKPPHENMISHKRISFKKDQITKDVIVIVKEKFSDNFGDLEPFYYAVTRKQALKELKHFIKEILPYFGDYQDAMMTGQPYLYHSLLASYLNAGLLEPLEICQLAEEAYKNELVELNNVEGFIRQILGWREYVRGVYWTFMPKYAEMNYLGSTENLPKLYWGGHTDMFCMAEVVKQTQQHAYSHHIQRLMITGNFALLAGIDVKQVQKWYLEVYSDAYEWVEMPNTLGMALFGDGGIIASKPYAASGNYIRKMSNFCDNCIYNSSELLTDNACPFNALYWDFIARHETKLNKNQRMRYAYATYGKFSIDKKMAISAKAKSILSLMRKNKL